MLFDESQYCNNKSLQEGWSNFSNSWSASESVAYLWAIVSKPSCSSWRGHRLGLSWGGWAAGASVSVCIKKDKHISRASVLFIQKCNGCTVQRFSYMRLYVWTELLATRHGPQFLVCAYAKLFHGNEVIGLFVSCVSKHSMPWAQRFSATSHLLVLSSWEVPQP